MLVIHSNCDAVVVSIQNFTEHIAQGGTNNVSCSVSVFSVLVDEYDPVYTNTYVFYCDRASNVQKTSKMLKVRYPRTTTLHQSEHVLVLLFTEIAKIYAAKVHARATA